MNAKEKMVAACKEAMRLERERCAKCVPTNWLDCLLSGPDAVLPKLGERITHQHIEALLRGVQDRIRGA